MKAKDISVGVKYVCRIPGVGEAPARVERFQSANVVKVTIGQRSWFIKSRDVLRMTQEGSTPESSDAPQAPPRLAP